MKLLGEMGPNLPRPYADLLRDGVHELRVKLSGEQIRLLYFFCYEYYIVFFEVFHKHTDKVPERYIIETANYRRSLLHRLSKEKFAKMDRGNTFEYAEHKLKDPDFRSQYNENCNICKITVELVNKMDSGRHSKEDLAGRAGVRIEDLIALEEGEKCRYDVVVKLCRELNVPVPEKCNKRGK
jgi:phage-related protein